MAKILFLATIAWTSRASWAGEVSPADAGVGDQSVLRAQHGANGKPLFRISGLPGAFKSDGKGASSDGGTDLLTVGLLGSVQFEEGLNRAYLADFLRDHPGVRMEPESLEQFVRLQQKVIRGCYAGEIKRSPQVRGQVTLRWLIDASGHATKVRTLTAFDADPALSKVATCIEGVARRWQFAVRPPIKVPVEYGFDLQP